MLHLRNHSLVMKQRVEGGVSEKEKERGRERERKCVYLDTLSSGADWCNNRSKHTQSMKFGTNVVKYVL